MVLHRDVEWRRRVVPLAMDSVLEPGELHLNSVRFKDMVKDAERASRGGVTVSMILQLEREEYNEYNGRWSTVANAVVKNTSRLIAAMRRKPDAIRIDLSTKTPLFLSEVALSASQNSAGRPPFRHRPRKVQMKAFRNVASPLLVSLIQPISRSRSHLDLSFQQSIRCQCEGMPHTALHRL